MLKKIYEGILLLAFFLVAMYGMGNAESGSQIFVPTLAMVALAVLMYKAGMMDEVLHGKSKRS